MCGIMEGIMVATTVAGAVQQSNAQRQAGRAAASAAGAQSAAAISQGVHEQAGFLAQADADRYNADTSFANKRIAERLSGEATQEGKLSEQISRLDTKQQIGLQRVAQAASGSVVDQGSNLNLVQDTAVFGEFEARNIRASTARRAQGFLDQGFNYGRTGDLQLLQAEHSVAAGDIAVQSGVASGEAYANAGEQALAAGKAQSAATLISAAGTVAGQWSKFSAKVPPGGSTGVTTAGGGPSFSPYSNPGSATSGFGQPTHFQTPSTSLGIRKYT